MKILQKGNIMALFIDKIGQGVGFWVNVK